MRLLDLLFPPRCIFCGRVLDAGDPHQCCAKCLSSLPFTAGPRRQGAAPSMIAAPFYYVDGPRNALRRFKFHGKTGYAGPLARFMAEEAQRRFPSLPELIVYAPVSKKRRRQRGYDQSELLAAELSALLALPLAPALEKVRDTPAQSSLHASQRRENVRQVYRCVLPHSVAGRRVLLIDDVCTTGATLSECARMLLEAGAAEVFGLAFAISEGLL